MKLPTTSDLAELPRWALVAFGARCARRLDSQLCILDDQGQLASNTAMRVAEQSAARAKALEAKEAAQAARAAASREWDKVQERNDDTDYSREFSAPAEVAALAAQAVIASDPCSKVGQIINEVNYVLGEESTADIARDFRFLEQATVENGWTKATAVAPHFFAIVRDSASLVLQAVRCMSDKLARLVSRDPSALDAIEWRDIERMLAVVFDGLGFEVELTPASKDGGKDVVLRYSHNGEERIYLVEVKHWRSGKRVGGKELTNFVHVVAREKCDGGLFLSTYGYSRDEIEVITEIDHNEIFLGEKPQIVSLCRSYMRADSGLWRSAAPLQEMLHCDFRRLAVVSCKDRADEN